MTIALPTTANELTPKQAAFAVAFVEGGDATAAYQATYDCLPDTARGTLHKRAYDLAHHPKVAAYIHALRQSIAEKFVVSEAQLRKEAYDLATADANAVCGIRVYGCRHCHGGPQHRYQYKDVAELAQALDAHLKAATSPKPLPFPLDAVDPVYGYDAFALPSDTCTECRGAGVVIPFFADTTRLTGAAAKLFKGFEIKPNGIKVLLHDQMAARDMVNKSVGLYKSVNLSLHAEVAPFQDMSMADMLATLNQLKPAQPAADPTVVATIEHQEPAP